MRCATAICAANTTGFKPGPAFPPGSYVFSVTVTGKHQKTDGSTEIFNAVAKLPIVLTP